MRKIYHMHLTSQVFKNKGITKGFEAHGFQVLERDWVGLRQRVGTVRMQKQIIKEVSNYKPDLFFAQVQTEGIFTADMAKEIMAICPVIMFTVDVRSVKESAWMYDLNQYVTHFFYASMRDVFWSGRRNASVLQSSCDADEYYHDPTNRKTPPIVFIGNKTERFPNSEHRTEMVNLLRSFYGNNFGAFGLGFGTEGYAFVDRERELYSNCKVAIIHNHFSYSGYTSDRYWRAIFCKADTVEYRRNTKVDDFIDAIDKKLYGHDEKSDSVKQALITNNTYRRRVTEIMSVLYQEYDIQLESKLISL